MFMAQRAVSRSWRCGAWLAPALTAWALGVAIDSSWASEYRLSTSDSDRLGALRLPVVSPDWTDRNAVLVPRYLAAHSGTENLGLGETMDASWALDHEPRAADAERLDPMARQPFALRQQWLDVLDDDETTRLAASATSFDPIETTPLPTFQARPFDPASDSYVLAALRFCQENRNIVGCVSLEFLGLLALIFWRRRARAIAAG